MEILTRSGSREDCKIRRVKAKGGDDVIANTRCCCGGKTYYRDFRESPTKVGEI